MCALMYKSATVTIVFCFADRKIIREFAHRGVK